MSRRGLPPLLSLPPYSVKHGTIFLGKFLVVPTSPKINYLYNFETRRDEQGVLLAKQHSDTPEWSSFDMFKGGVTSDDVVFVMKSIDMDSINI